MRKRTISGAIEMLISSVLVFAMMSCGGGGGGGGSNTANPPDPEGTYAFTAPLARLTTRVDVLTLVTGKTYYLDANTGSDDDNKGDGSSSLPWKTLTKVHTVLQSGDCVVMRTGNYGVFNETAIRSAPTVYIADARNTPVLTNISLRDNDTPNHTVGNPETAFKTNLVFYGIGIVPAYVNPGTTDPMDSTATINTYSKCNWAVDLKWYGAIKFINCYMSPSADYNSLSGTAKKYLSGYGISLYDSPDIWIEGCELDSFNSGIAYSSSPRLRAYYNKIHGTAGGIISNKDSQCQDSVIEGNHLYDDNWATTDPYCSRVDYYHGSLMSVRSSNTVVRNNIMHFGGGSSGMMLYADGASAYDNILIEGNQIYDPNNVFVLRLYNVNSNIVIRNNTIICRGQYNVSGEYKYNTAIILHSFSGTATGKRLFLYNNVIVGRLDLDGSTTGLDKIDVAGNVAYFSSLALPAGNLVAYPGGSVRFDSGFFLGALDVSWQNWESGGGGLPNPHGNGKILDLSLAAGSPANGYGVAAVQAPTRISGFKSDGTLFLNLSIARTASEHSAGAMEQTP